MIFELHPIGPDNSQVIVFSPGNAVREVMDVEMGDTVLGFSKPNETNLDGSKVKGIGIQDDTYVLDSSDIAITLSKPVECDLESATLAFETLTPIFTVNVAVTSSQVVTCRATIKAEGRNSTAQLTVKN